MKQFKKSLLIIGLCFLMIGCTNDAMSKLTKKLQDAGYDISYLTDDFTAVNITKTEKDKDRIQFCAYLEKKVVTSISYIVLPADNSNIDKTIIGFIYVDKNDDNIISESAQKEAKKILKKLDLSIDDLVNYALQVHEDKGKSLNS